MESTTYKNEIAKRKFYKDLLHSKGYSAKTIESFKQAIWLWQEFTNNDDFMYFNQTKAVEFKETLRNKIKRNSESKVSLSYCYDMLRHLSKFFHWLSQQSGYKRISKTAIEYLNLSRAEIRIATQSKGRQSPTLEEVKMVIESIVGTSEIEMRDRALISLMFLTGARISAITSLPLRSFDRGKLIIDQDPKIGVKTKNSKRIITALVSLPYREPLDYFLKWFDYLNDTRKFQPNDPIFPATKVENGTENLGYYSNKEVEPVFWKSSSSPRKVFEKRFKQAGIKYYHPHTFRHLLVKEISKLPLTEEQKKAFSQNLGHENVGTTFGSYGYGAIEADRQVDIIRDISFNDKRIGDNSDLSKEELLKLIGRNLKD